MENQPSLKEGQKCPEIDLIALKNGDKGAFAHFVRTYQGMVFACCRSAGLTHEDIEDAASEAFLTAYQAIHRYNGKGKLSSWLWVIAYRKALDIQRKKQNKEVLNIDVIKAASDWAEISENELESKEESEVIWDAVQQLPAKWIPSIVLFYREGKTIVEIAEILDIPANSIKTYLNRGRNKLYELLEKYWKNHYVKT